MYKSNNSKFIRELFWFLYSFGALKNQPLTDAKFIFH